jgi:two-component system chemotaxis response regulator CheY
MAKRILAVDDSAIIRQVEQNVLVPAGYELVLAVDGKDALVKLETGTFNLIITDLNMPNMDGVALIKAVRGGKSHKFTPIIMLTTESKDTKKQEGKTAGATGWVVKPFTGEQLLAVVKKVIG